MNEKVTCPRCDGKGELSLKDLAPHLVGTLAYFTKERPEVTASLAKDLCPKRIGITGMNNRLEKLRVLGFLQRQKRKGSYVYFRVKGN